MRVATPTRSPESRQTLILEHRRETGPRGECWGVRGGWRGPRWRSRRGHMSSEKASRERPRAADITNRMGQDGAGWVHQPGRVHQGIGEPHPAKTQVAQ